MSEHAEAPTRGLSVTVTVYLGYLLAGVPCAEGADQGAKTGILRGTVVDSSGQPVVGALVSVNAISEATAVDFPHMRAHTDGCMTEKGGAFEIYVPPGTYLIRVPLPAHGSEVVIKGVKSGTRGLILSPAKLVVTEELLGEAVDALWEGMDRNYSYFFLKKDVDWSALKRRYRPAAVGAKSVRQFAETLKEMLSHLKDMHVWIVTPKETLATHSIPWRRNWHPRPISASLAT